MRSAPAIGFDYRPSAVPRRLLLAMLALALLAIAGSGLSLVIRLGLGVVVVCAGIVSMQRGRRSEVTGVGIGESWRLYRPGHVEEPATLVSHRLVGPLVLLSLKGAARVEHLVLAPDNCTAELRRRVRMRLLAGQPGSAEP